MNTLMGAHAGVEPAWRDLFQLTTGLQSTLGRMELALGSLAEAIVWSDATGTIQWCNSTFRRFTRRPHLALLGRPLESVLPLTQAGRPVAGPDYPAAKVLAQPDAGGVPVTGIYCLGSGESQRVLEVYCTVLRSAGDGPCAVTVIRDVTEKYLAEEMLELETRRLELLRQVSEAANDTDSPEEALQVALDWICEHTGWPLGHALTVNGIPPALEPSDLWHDASGGSYAEFREVARSMRWPAGLGLPGKVWETRTPVWVEDLASEPGFKRRDAALRCGLVSALAFPVLVGREVTAVIELFSGRAQAADEGLLRVVSQIGTQLGRVVERRRSQQAILRSKRELESRVAERTSELQAANRALRSEIEQRETAQAALREAMDLYHSLVQSVRDVIFAVSPKGAIESLNPAFEESTGYPAGSWIGRRCLRLVHPGDRVRAIGALRELTTGAHPSPFELRIRRAQGGWTAFECSLSPRHNGQTLVNVFGIARDITERRRAEALLILQDRAMASTSEGILITDALAPGNPIVYANRGFERLTGYSASDIMGLSCGFLQGPATSPAAVAEIRAALAGQRQCTVELQNYRKDGTIFWNRLSITPIRDRSGQLTHFIGVQSDVSSQKEAERLKNELVSTVSHELRTPLTSLRGFAELMLERDFPLEKRRKFLEIIQREATRLTTLINDFLDIQRMESGRQEYRFENCSIALLIQETVTIFQGSNPGHTFVCTIPARLPAMVADPDRLRQVLSNLTSNAVKFSPEGGVVTFSASYRPADNMVICSVRDQGIGIPREAIPRLFGKFYRVDNTETRKIGGTGLGLALVKQIIEAHKGRIWVESAPGQGSLFSFTVPAVGAKQPVGV